MGNRPDNNSDEITFSQVTDKINHFFGWFNNTIFNFILFVKRNIIILSILFIIGAVLGFYLDSKSKTFSHKIIVTPNFGSVDYLYAKVDLMDSKISQGDTAFIKALGINPKKFLKIEIEPIDDVYEFVNSNERNFELLKLMSENANMSEIIKDETTSKNYFNHLITIQTNGTTNYQQAIKPLLEYLNDTDHFKELQKIYIQNIENKINQNEKIIAQIDGILNQFNQSDKNLRNDKLVYYNENTQLNDIINTKNKLIIEQGNNQIDKVKLDSVVKQNSVTLNVQNPSKKFKIILPLVFIALFIIAYLSRAYYKKQLYKRSL